jgi:hypothetical protein
MDIVVKIDGDGQMDPALLPLFIEPIVQGRADYTKGNRFFNLETLIAMPKFALSPYNKESLLKSSLSCPHLTVINKPRIITNVPTKVLYSIASFKKI